MKNFILIARGVAKLGNGKRNAKDYPYWDELVQLLKEKGYQTIELTGELPLNDLNKIINESGTVICVDSFVQHYAWYLGKKAIVLWGPSDPLIFGHPENINLLKDRKYLRPDQWVKWDNVKHEMEAFCPPEDILKEIEKMV